MERVIELLNGITEETSVEEIRRIILDVSELCISINDNIKALNDMVQEQQTVISDKDFEIARLKEENGRIYRDRAERIMRDTEDKIDEVVDKTDAELEAELISNIDI